MIASYKKGVRSISDNSTFGLYEYDKSPNDMRKRVRRLFNYQRKGKRIVSILYMPEYPDHFVHVCSGLYFFTNSSGPVRGQHIHPEFNSFPVRTSSTSSVPSANASTFNPFLWHRSTRSLSSESIRITAILGFISAITLSSSAPPPTYACKLRISGATWRKAFASLSDLESKCTILYTFLPCERYPRTVQSLPYDNRASASDRSV